MGCQKYSTHELILTKIQSNHKRSWSIPTEHPFLTSRYASLQGAEVTLYMAFR